ncbi:MAG: hypothetical protein ACYDGR_17580 [Candidatus Dormibacteria bacterium]
MIFLALDGVLVYVFRQNRKLSLHVDSSRVWATGPAPGIVSREELASIQVNYTGFRVPYLAYQFRKKDGKVAFGFKKDTFPTETMKRVADHLGVPFDPHGHGGGEQ